MFTRSLGSLMPTDEQPVQHGPLLLQGLTCCTLLGERAIPLSDDGFLNRPGAQVRQQHHRRVGTVHDSQMIVTVILGVILPAIS